MLTQGPVSETWKGNTVHRVVRVEVLKHLQLSLTFEDGVTGSVDLSDLEGKGVFCCWNDPKAFQQVAIGDTGELMWPGQVDLCPDSLYLRVAGKSPESIFPGLKGERLHA